ncbi:MAG: DNA polymerase IV [Gammaproteobacteria bacterium]|nr:DNA polymerase IV [Gammaproteobacteria bacterium]MCW8840160.1 DNA polymerase IV [Gammaproteobacteria bacterium]MCW8959833.1 DNA polymerase IV [Gammaproteobacteria bacterium]MCW8972853.1 DNA polymerase IV [Gammaproteobacteria bacterium]MCW8992074.1 DNA polymerase IV [Gammaproteobacteria bacterium]
MPRQIIHVDMDAFYASVEIRERPELADRPVIVGGRPQGRGVVAAANYIARRFGVHSAMPTSTALRLCPEAIVLPPRHELYAGVSLQLHAIFQRYTPQIEPLALDEAFLDVTGSIGLFGPAEKMAREIKQAVWEELQLVASVGVGPNKYIAKLASDIDKPDGFVVVVEGDVAAFLAPLPVSRLWGVGKVAVKTFDKLGIRTIAQLRGYSPQLLRQHLGSSGEQFLRLASGIDERPVISEHEAKSISNETTFAVDISDARILHQWLQALTGQVAYRLRAQGLKGRTVQLKVRLADFTTLTRSHTLPEPTDITAEIGQAVQFLFNERLPRPLPPVRLLGVGVSKFAAEEQHQADLFVSAERERQQRLDALMDRMQSRFGKRAIRRGKDPASG